MTTQSDEPPTEQQQQQQEKDVAWREYDIHDSDDDVDQEEQNAFDIFGRDEPLETVDFTFPEQLPDVTIQLQCQEDYTQSTGMAIWLGSDVLVEYLLQNKNLVSDKKVLEVGAGVGMCGIIAHHLQAASVVLTDGDLDALNNLRHNVQHNTDTKTCSCHQLVWGKQVPEFRQAHGSFDVILGADLFYMTRSIQPLFQTVDQLLTKDGIFLASSPSAKQNSFEEILQVVANEGFSWTEEASDVYIFRRRKTEETEEKS